ncbi:MAG TPA: EAL domain-containing protein [Noviherbaspirillum sp.]|nr:EAL domain-containing protein [Noviherbaspirillum sp.]
MNMHYRDELNRLDTLNYFEILDTPPEPVFDKLAQFAARICEVPIAAITLIDEHRQWFKSSVGLEVTETAREVAFCAHTIKGTHPFVVHDASKNPLFQHNPLVTGPPDLRFYTGIPLITSGGFALGALAVMDRVPRTLNDAQISTLEMLAEQIIVHIELRQQRKELERVAAERDRANVDLQHQAEDLSEAQRIARIGSWKMHMPTRSLTCSAEIYRIFGLQKENKTEEFSAFMSSVHRDDRQHLENALQGVLKGEQSLDIEHRIVRPGGEIRYVRERAELHMKSAGQILSGTVQDITEQRESQEQLHLLHTCISRLNDIVMITEAEPLEEPGPRIVFVNNAFEKHTGYLREEVLGKSPRILQGPNTQRQELDRIRAALQQKKPVWSELINYTRSGKEFWLETDIVPVADPSGRVSHFAAIQRDITHRKNTEQEIERLAFYDPLTGLPNRRLLLDRLQHAVAVAARNGNAGALLYIDLDNFKSLNDTLGHDKGDMLLTQIAERLEHSVRKSNTVARFGGDEFVVMIENLSKDPWEAAAQAELVAEKILASFQDPYQLDGYDYHSSPSIGVAMFNHHGNSVEELLKRADLAMYQAKASGRNAIRFFDPQMQARVNARVALERDLRGSLHRQEFVLHYQPQFHSNGRVTGAEALVRWIHPQRGLIYPDTFISLAEETGLITRLGQWVLEKACAQLVTWSTMPSESALNLAVNVSARQFRHPDFVKQALAVIDSSGANPHNLKLELTESVLVENLDDTIAKMSALKSHGIGFSLDDFGTGYSSLSYLKRLPLDQLKIDRSFVRDVLDDTNDAAIARTIVALGQALELDVIAEGVETEGQRGFLADNGCHSYQGYLFSKPLPAEQFHA